MNCEKCTMMLLANALVNFYKEFVEKENKSIEFEQFVIEKLKPK